MNVILCTTSNLFTLLPTDRLANTRVIISDTAAFEDGTECGFIGEEGNDPEVTVTCAVIGRYVTLQRDAAGEQPYTINICEVEVEGQQGNFPANKAPCVA